MIRPLHTWVLFGLCVALATAAMGYVSWTAVRLDRAEVFVRQQAEHEENIRLALWRMDSKLAPLIAQESGRPYFFYSAFYPAERCYSCMLGPIDADGLPLPSPLLWFSSPRILAHFQIDPAGTVSSPQEPEGEMQRLAAEKGYTIPSRELAVACVPRIESMVKRGPLLAQLPEPDPETAERIPVQVAIAQALQPYAQQSAAPPPPQFLQEQEETPSQSPGMQQARPQVSRSAAQRQKSSQEWTKRNEYYQNYQTVANSGNNELIIDAGIPVVEGMIRPVWVEDLLMLARRVRTVEGEYIQGCVLNWPMLRRELLAETADLLPAADLEPIGGSTVHDRSVRMLAALPVRLDPGPVPVGSARASSPIRISLVLAWACVFVAAAAVGALLVGAVTLSERRGSFVSAVTHELRTPLTTLRMYTEMLADGMVRSDDQRRRYLQTLRAEADRLGHLVENVLAYSRIERGRARSQVIAVPLGELIGRVQGRLAERAEQAGMNLIVRPGEEAGRCVRADPSGVEQILFNLVDNACKYAANGHERAIDLAVESVNGEAAITVRDHGPGITRQEARHLFRPFSKSARDAANSAPGVGLGLALSRRLAREMGGDLRLDHGQDSGAHFRLVLPMVKGE